MAAPPVFVDPSGRRRRLLRRASVGAGVAVMLVLGVLSVSLLGGPGLGNAPWSPDRGPGNAAPPSARVTTPPERIRQTTPTTGATRRTTTTSSPTTSPTTVPSSPTVSPTTPAPAKTRKGRKPTAPPGRDKTSRPGKPGAPAG